MSSFKELVVWQKGMDVVKEVYTLTKKLPKDEMHGLVSQMRRAAVSIPSNIAEGSARYSKKEFHHFIMFAHGSAAELETQLYLAKEIYDIDISSAELILVDVQKMLTGLGKKL
jgi:four helix bundle protein